MTRTHLSNSAQPITLTAVDQDPQANWKPAGFWYEVDGDWRRWCSDEQFDTDRRHLHAIDLGETRLLVIDTLAKLDAFHAEFAEPLLGTGTLMAVDWGRVATGHDGVEIAPYQWERRFDYLWYAGWDCASGCIWRPNGASVTYLTELPADWHDAAHNDEATSLTWPVDFELPAP